MLEGPAGPPGLVSAHLVRYSCSVAPRRPTGLAGLFSSERTCPSGSRSSSTTRTSTSLRTTCSLPTEPVPSTRWSTRFSLRSA